MKRNNKICLKSIKIEDLFPNREMKNELNVFLENSTLGIQYSSEFLLVKASLKAPF